jgi:predicted molibdopterin-dependent oxidoreductase YjgC
MTLTTANAFLRTVRAGLPVGALIEKKCKGLGRTWELKQVRTTCPYCGVGCQQMLHVKGEQIVKITAAEDGAPNYGKYA